MTSWRQGSRLPGNPIYVREDGTIALIMAGVQVAPSWISGADTSHGADHSRLKWCRSPDASASRVRRGKRAAPSSNTPSACARLRLTIATAHNERRGQKNRKRDAPMVLGKASCMPSGGKAPPADASLRIPPQWMRDTVWQAPLNPSVVPTSNVYHSPCPVRPQCDKAFRISATIGNRNACFGSSATATHWRWCATCAT